MGKHICRFFEGSSQTRIMLTEQIAGKIDRYTIEQLRVYVDEPVSIFFTIKLREYGAGKVATCGLPCCPQDLACQPTCLCLSLTPGFGYLPRGKGNQIPETLFQQANVYRMAFQPQSKTHGRKISPPRVREQATDCEEQLSCIFRIDRGRPGTETEVNDLRRGQHALLTVALQLPRSHAIPMLMCEGYQLL